MYHEFDHLLCPLIMKHNSCFKPNSETFGAFQNLLWNLTCFITFVTKNSPVDFVLCHHFPEKLSPDIFSACRGSLWRFILCLRLFCLPSSISAFFFFSSKIYFPYLSGSREFNVFDHLLKMKKSTFWNFLLKNMNSHSKKIVNVLIYSS